MENPLIAKLEHGARCTRTTRQLPGDLCDLHVAILGEMDHGIATLSACGIVHIPRQTVEELTEKHGRINRALW